MSFTEQEAIDKLQKDYKWVDHPEHCIEADYHFETEDTEHPNYDGVVTMKCWNCPVQDHYLFSEE